MPANGRWDLIRRLKFKLVAKENHRIVKDEDKWGLAKSLTTHYKIIFPFLKNAVYGQTTGMFEPKKNTCDIKFSF